MLEGLRIASQNWIGRTIMAIVMGVIVVSFAIWGVGDVFRGMTAQRLARVGSGEITVEAYRNAYQMELRRIQQKLRRAVTNQEARQAGLDQQVLERLVLETALDQKARALGLASSDQTTQQLLAQEKVFQGVDGKFDPERFKQIARDAGFSERGFVTEEKAAYIRRMLSDVVIAGVEPPVLMIEAIHRFRNETRAVDYFIIPTSAISSTPQPSDEELKKYYDEREQVFKAKEYRKLTILTVSPSSIGKPNEVSADEIKKLYDDVKTKRFGAPEKRDVRQIVLKTETEAEDALAKLKKGIELEALAKELNLNPKDVNLGLVEQRDFGDPNVGAAVFAVAKPGLAEPVKTAFGTVISQVKSITPAVFTKTLEQATAELRNEIAAQKSSPEVKKLRDLIEDQRASGKTLAETAAAAKLDVRIIDNVDNTGHDKNGKNIDELTVNLDLLKAAFASDVGVDNDTVATRDGGYVWFEINAIEPARQKTFDEVRPAVLEALRLELAQKALTEKGEDATNKLRLGRSIDEIAKSFNVEVKRATDIKRAPRPEFTPNTIVQFFDAPPHGAGSVAVDSGRLVFFVKDSVNPTFDPNSIESKTIAEQLKPALQNDLIEQYVGGLEKHLGVDINQKVLESLTGADKEP
ncbi:peptidylprolyl isomerase [Methylocystaceae bacterium]|nr:peptidylprolyl isomerase [Methylocystaceae bacterium]